MIEHHIQREILNRLMSTQSLRFSELKPDGMESNIFMYHVRQLQRAHYIAKDDLGRYTLQPPGLSYVDNLQGSHNLKPTRQPKIIAILALQNKAGQWLLVKRKTQPYIGQYMFLSGQQHFGESLSQQAERELLEKHISGVKLGYRGIADIQIVQGSAILTHVLAHVHYGVYDGPLPKEDHQFIYEWTTIQRDLAVMAGTRELHAHLIQDDSGFVLTLAVQTAIAAE